jgi:hypothetical protein
MLTITQYSNEEQYSSRLMTPEAPEIELTLHDLQSGRQVTFELPVELEPLGVNVFSDRPLPDSPILPEGLYVSPYVHDETAERIVVLQFVAQGLMAFVSVRKLIRFYESSISNGGMQADDDADESHYSWDEWGPNSSLWMYERTIDGGYTSVCGSKFCGLSFHRDHFTTNESNIVIKGETNWRPNPTATRTIIIMDFNPRPIIRDNILNGETGDEQTGKGLNWKKMFKSIRISEKEEDTNKKKKKDNSGMKVRWIARPPRRSTPIVSGLPFRVYQKHVHQEYQDMIMGIDHLVGITVSLFLLKFQLLSNSKTGCGTASIIIRCFSIFASGIFSGTAK